MWNYQMLPSDMDLLPKFAKHSVIAGIVMVVLGGAALFYPFVASLFTVGVVAWLMLFAGLTAGYLTWRTDASDWLGWFKAFILVGTGLFILFYPMTGIAAIGLLLAIYFLLDTFAGFALGSMMRPAKGWWLWTLNGLFSLILAVIFLVYWPSIEAEAWLIGVFVGISLLFDGFMLLFMGGTMKKMLDEQSGNGDAPKD